MITESLLICNYPKCRKKLEKFAWVTSCSHIFCDEDGSKEFQKSLACPACESSLANKFDIVRIDLQPSEAYKSMLLAGQTPEVALEIYQKSLSFWKYQIQQELSYQEHINYRSKEKSSQLEQYYTQLMSRAQTELTNLKSQLAIAKKEAANAEKELREAVSNLSDKNNQCQKLKMMCDSLKRKPINSYQNAGKDNQYKSSGCLGTPRHNEILTSDDMLKRPGSSVNILESFSSDFGGFPHKERGDTDEFVLRPSLTPLVGPQHHASDLFKMDMRPFNRTKPRKS